MPYGIIKVDTITFTDASSDKSINISGLVKNPTFSGNVTATGTISGASIQGGTLVSGATVTGSAGQFTSITGGTAGFTTVTGTTVFITSGVFASGTASAPSFAFTGNLNTGIYSPGTNQVAVSTSGTGRVFVATDGKVGVGISAPLVDLHVNNVAGARIRAGGGVNAGFEFNGSPTRFDIPAANTIAAYTSDFERLRIDNSGRLLVGTSTSLSGGLFFNGASTQDQTGAQYAANNWQGASASFFTYQNSINVSSQLSFNKSRATTVGGFDVVTSGDDLGSVVFSGADGSKFVPSACIYSEVDGTPGLNAMPGRLIFATTADGASSPTERMRIGSTGAVAIGTTITAGGGSGCSIRFANPLTGSTNAVSIFGTPQVQADATGSPQVFSSAPSTAASAVLGDLRHYNATNVTLGSGSSLVNQYAYFVGASFPAATNNYGFFSAISSGTGRWAFYSQGTADSYFASNNFIFANGGTERARFDSTGRLLLGSSSTVSVPAWPGDFTLQYNGILQTNGTTVGTSAIVSTAWNNGASIGGTLSLAKSRSTTIGTYASGLVSGDTLGNIVFSGDDSQKFVAAAFISAVADGTPGLNDMPGRLIFATTADGASSPTERMRIGSTGAIAIGSTTTTGGASGCSIRFGNQLTGSVGPASIVGAPQVQADATGDSVIYQSSPSTAASVTASSITHYRANSFTLGSSAAVTNQYAFVAASALTAATNNYGFYANIASATGCWNFYANGTADSYFASNNFIFANGGTEKARVDSSGRLLLGTSTALGVASATASDLEIETTGIPLSAVRNSADATGPVIALGKSRGATAGSLTAVVNGDILGEFRFAGADGTTRSAYGAAIQCRVDGAPGTNDMPGRLVFGTTADGAASPTEHWRISSNGTFIYNQPAPAAVDTTATLSVANMTAKIITSTTAAAVTMTLPTGTDMDAGFSGLYTNMSFEWSVINTGATNAVTVQANTGHTIVGSATVAASNSGTFLSRRTATNTWVTYRLSS